MSKRKSAAPRAERPAGGGSYIRGKDGRLRRVEGPEEAPPATPSSDEPGAGDPAPPQTGEAAGNSEQEA